jgi:hypothetical protein
MESGSKDFLEYMWSQNATPEARYGELRIINHVKVRQDYIPLDRIAAVQVMRFGEGDDIYYGVLPRTRQSGVADAVVSKTRWIWADFDNKHVPEGKAFFQLMKAPVVPNVIIDSGHGYHAYWLLDRFEPFAVVSQVMKNISGFFGGDHVQDAPRVLRVPWTTNWKEEPVPVRMIKWDMTEQGYPLEAFDRILPLPKRPDVLPSVRMSGEPKDNTEWLQELIETDPGKGFRSEHSFKVVLWMVRYGKTYDEIEQIFRDNPTGVGAKFAERGNGPRWLMTVYRAASEAK